MKLLKSCLLFVALLCFISPAFAGAPLLEDNCRDKTGRPVPIVYNATKTRYFAEASPDLSPSVIYVNPELYFLGQRTQQWLYQRQCVHIQKEHPIATKGEQALRPEDEEEADCLAMLELSASLAKGASQGSSLRMLRSSVESDMERLLKEERWRQVLPGPQRRILFDKCPK